MEMGISPSNDNSKDQDKVILKQAWKLFSQYDLNAGLQQSLYRKMQFYILLLGVIVTILVLSESYFDKNIWFASLQPWLKNLIIISLQPWLKNLIIIIPIAISTLVAISTFFRFGNKWVNLRTAAETLKSEIYQFRTTVGKYSPKSISDNQPITKPEDVLFNQIQTISNQLMGTEVALSTLRKYEGQIPPKMFGADQSQDDGYSTLTSNNYVNARLEPQISFYQKRTKKMYRNLMVLQILVLIGGGVGTFIAAIGLELWVALTATFVSVFTIYLQYNQIENTLIKYNQSLNGLNNIQVWWASLTDNERNDIKNRDKLVNATEQILLMEHQVWVKNMKQAVSKIHKIEEEKTTSK
jgi:conflict system pore-forming effector with SLATT domain/uncharacterized protein DUF4231